MSFEKCVESVTEKKSKEGLIEMLRENKLDVVNGEYNIVVEENGEFLMRNLMTKETQKASTIQTPGLPSPNGENKVCMKSQTDSSKKESVGNNIKGLSPI